MWNYRILLLVFLLKLNQGQEDLTYNLTDPLKAIITPAEIGIAMKPVTDESDSKENKYKVFLCPKKSAHLHQSTSEQETLENECLVKMDGPSQCFKEFQPKFRLKSERCGRKKQGSLYSFEYDLCLVKKGPTEMENDNSLSIKYPSSDAVYDIESDASSSQPDTNIKTEAISLILYSVCFDDAKMETLYTTYRIFTNENIRVPIPNLEDFIAKIKTYLPNGSKEQPGGFNAVHQWIMNNKHNNDHVIPRPYVPPRDIDPLWMRGMYLHSLNIGFIWNDKNFLWYRIDNAITKHVKYPKAEIYTSTSEVLKIDNKDWTFGVNGVTIRAYFMWWKLITIPSDNGYLGFIVVLYNVPLNYPLTKSQYLCVKSICNDINFYIDESPFIQCCPATKSILDRLGYQGGKTIADKLIFTKKSPENSLENSPEN